MERSHWSENKQSLKTELSQYFHYMFFSNLDSFWGQIFNLFVDLTVSLEKHFPDGRCSF